MTVFNEEPVVMMERANGVVFMDEQLERGLELMLDLLDTELNKVVIPDQVGSSLETVDYRRMVPVSERLADLDKLQGKEVSREVDGDLSRNSKRSGTRLGAQGFSRYPPGRGDDLLNAIN